MTLLDTPRRSLRERSIPVLETERLALRAPRLEDAKAVAMLANDRRIAENTARIPHPYRAGGRRGLHRHGQCTTDEAVSSDHAGNGALIGACGFSRFDGHPPEIGYWLGVKHWGKGYATEAVRAVIDHAFTDLGCEALHSSARVTNPASRRVLEKCGFQWTGVGLLRIRALAISAPIDRFRLDRGLWASLKSWGRATRGGPPTG